MHHCNMERLQATITNHYQSWYFAKKSGNIVSSCIKKSLLHGYETWPASSETIRRLTFADNGMVGQICGIRLEQRIKTQELHEKLGIISVPNEIRWRKLRYFGHLQRMNTNVWPGGVNDYVVFGILPRGRLSQKTSKTSTSGKNLLSNRYNGEGQLCQEKYYGQAL